MNRREKNLLLAGLEPATTRIQDERSNHLSYRSDRFHGELIPLETSRHCNSHSQGQGSNPPMNQEFLST